VYKGYRNGSPHAYVHTDLRAALTLGHDMCRQRQQHHLLLVGFLYQRIQTHLTSMHSTHEPAKPTTCRMTNIDKDQRSTVEHKQATTGRLGHCQCAAQPKAARCLAKMDLQRSHIVCVCGQLCSIRAICTRHRASVSWDRCMSPIRRSLCRGLTRRGQRAGVAQVPRLQ
jgi:hypothetical protein